MLCFYNKYILVCFFYALASYLLRVVRGLTHRLNNFWTIALELSYSIINMCIISAG